MKHIQAGDLLQCRQVEEKPGTSTFAVGTKSNLLPISIALNSFMKRKVSFRLYQRQLNKRQVCPILNVFLCDPIQYLRRFTKTPRLTKMKNRPKTDIFSLLDTKTSFCKKKKRNSVQETVISELNISASMAYFSVMVDFRVLPPLSGI